MNEQNPVPNFLRVSGHRATFDYRNVSKVCRRCRKEGHFRTQCKEEYCERCSSFGHTTVACSSACRRCGDAHATADCVNRRSYSAAARGLAADPVNVPLVPQSAPVTPLDPAVPEGAREPLPASLEATSTITPSDVATPSLEPVPPSLTDPFPEISEGETEIYPLKTDKIDDVDSAHSLSDGGATEVALFQDENAPLLSTSSASVTIEDGKRSRQPHDAHSSGRDTDCVIHHKKRKPEMALAGVSSFSESSNSGME